MSGDCLDIDGEKLDLFPCHHMGGSQTWIMTPEGSIKYDGMCLYAPDIDGDVIVRKCHEQGGTQKWHYNEVSNNYLNLAR